VQVVAHNTLVINNDRTGAHSLRLPLASERYTLDAVSLDDKVVRLNGAPLSLGPNGVLPALAGVRTPAGEVAFAAGSRF